MGGQKSEKIKKHLCMGLLAHVDAGKTTLSEAMLFLSGAIRKLGRVDKKDAYLDTDAQERARGITIFSKQARFRWNDLEITLLDTPGHVDFSAEMERTLQALDCAVLIVSGADGVQGHTETLWRLLQKHRIPTFIFVNKMDQPGAEKEALLEDLKENLSENCIDFGVRDETFFESIAMCGEDLLEQYLERGFVEEQDIVRLAAQREVFPVYFGSALKADGVKELLDGISRYTEVREYGQEFGAAVFKISRDSQGGRLTHLKVTGGTLRVKDLITYTKGTETFSEKVNQIRLYSGEKYELVQEARAGSICTVTGLGGTYPGQGLGARNVCEKPSLEPVLAYRMFLPQDVGISEALSDIRKLAEEEPELRPVWNETLKELHVQLMGEVQTEVLKTLLKERFGLAVTFGSGSIIYKETIAGSVRGIGHYEPLRHYAEVHLLMEAGEAGSGMTFFSDCSEDVLDKNWQRLILTHLAERKHIGVLTGAELTDMRISVIGGRAHLKHTEGGDFRQSTYRAVRQGLMKAQNVLLEPYYEFRLTLPSELLGRAMADMEQRFGKCEPPEIDGDTAVLSGKAPVACLRDYPTEVLAYSGGRGRLVLTPCGYAPCHNAEEVIAAVGYNADADMEHPSGSVFCAHGAGYYVPWNEVDALAHAESGAAEKKPERPVVCRSAAQSSFSADDRELEEIFKRTYGESKREKSRLAPAARSADYGENVPKKETAEHLKEYLLVDGYNIIFAWEELRELAKDNIEAARGKLMDILCNYQGYTGCTLILVFDAYKVQGNPGELHDYHNIHVVYTKEAETADQYIEKLAHEIGRKYRVTVATSDGLEQLIIRGQGCLLMSARELWEEIGRMKQELRREYLERCPQGQKNYLFDHLEDELAFYMEQVRLGRAEI